MRKRLIALAMVLLLILPGCGLGEDGAWICTACGQEGNTGNFCSNCGAARLDAAWTCSSCGQEGNTGNYCSNCGAAHSEEAASADSVSRPAAAADPALEQIPGETERVKVIPDGTDASSYIVNKKIPDRWVPANAADGDESTCWQFSAKKGLKGKSWISLGFAAPQTVDEVWFKNGFWAVNDKGKDQYPINARLKGIRIEFCYAGRTDFADGQEFTLKDESRSGWQVCPVGRHENVSRIRVAVLSVYKGSAYPNDVCLSEVMAVRAAPAESAMPAGAQKAATVYESRPDVTGCSLLMKLATRSGPGTQYAEPGTFFQNNWKKQTVLVKKKKWDGSIWWVQVDFQNGTKSRYRVWTGVKRVDVDLNRVSEETRICDCDIYPTSDTWYGPGGKYAKAKVSINRSAVGTIYGQENGYVDVEYWYEDDGYDGSHRVWLPESAVYNLYYGDYSGEN